MPRSVTVHVAPPPSGGFPPDGALWSAGHEVATLGEEWGGAGEETGTGDGGGGFFTSGGTRSFEISDEQAHSGNNSLKMTIDTSVQETGVRAFRWAEPQSETELYFSSWYYLPTLVTPSVFWNVQQIKSKRNPPNDSVNDPMWTLNIGNRASGGDMFFYMFQHGGFLGGSNQSHGQTAADIPVATWFHLEWHHVQSTGTNADGRVQLWQDGTQLWDFQNVRTRYSDGDNQWSTTNYSDGLSPAVASIYQDDLAISQSRIGV